ncbi:MAG TPA: hypothetical protein VJZ32_10195 [Candidatus Bathyarchaeia archaeon]|nr:hypothetical protein [Candidatus Bathyarchaeia archaeon]
MEPTWENWVTFVRLSKPAHENTFIPKDTCVHPSQAGFVSSLGDSEYSVPHYRLGLPDGSGIHVAEYSDGYLIHWDYVDPGINLVGHIQYDAPQYLPLLNAAISIGIVGVIVAGLSILDS